MSRSGYYDDDDSDYPRCLWRSAVRSAIHGNRGQAFLREMLAALDAMPVKELIAGDIVRPEDGAACAIGAVALARGLDVSEIDPADGESVAEAFGIAPAMAREIAYENDERQVSYREAPAERWQRMRQWLLEQIVPTDEEMTAEENRK